MSDDPDFGDDVTTKLAVNAYQAATPVFQALLREMRELSRKKPDATLSLAKVRMLNRVLVDLLEFLKGEPTGKYLESLNEDLLPQVSDAVLTMVQFDSALDAFKGRYYQRVHGTYYWITRELLEEWSAVGEGGEGDDEEDEADEDDEDDDTDVA